MVDHSISSRSTARLQMWCVLVSATVMLGVFPLVVIALMFRAHPPELTLLTGFLLPETGLTGPQVAQVFITQRTRLQLVALVFGLIPICMAVMCAVVAARIRKMERDFPLFTVMWIISSCVVIVTPLFMSVILALTAYRPAELDPDVTRMLNDFEWLIIIYTWPIFTVWSFSAAVPVLRCPRGQETIPRWVAYGCLTTAIWCPAGLTAIIPHGLFAYDGLFGTYVPLLVLFGWAYAFFFSVAWKLRQESRPGNPDRVRPAPSSYPL